MTNEMLRPCIIKDISESPFDACIAEVFKDSEDLEAYILLREEKNRMCLFKHYVKCNSIEELDSMYNSWILIIAQALNPPIKVTQAVLKAMAEVPEAKFSLITKQFAGRAGTLPIYWEKQEKRWFAINGNFAIVVGDYIQADCPLALQVLLGFIIEGVPKDA
jgi:hypothetical protein